MMKRNILLLISILTLEVAYGASKYQGDLVIKPQIWQYVDFKDPATESISERLVRIEKNRYQFEQAFAYSKCRSHMFYPKIIYSKSYDITQIINKTIETFLDLARISKCTPNMKAIYEMNFSVPKTDSRYFSIIFDYTSDIELFRKRKENNITNKMLVLNIDKDTGERALISDFCREECINLASFIYAYELKKKGMPSSLINTADFKMDNIEAYIDNLPIIFENNKEYYLNKQIKLEIPRKYLLYMPN